ncbi:hypothetical protein RA19_06620 [Leisingera sp. ANG-M1]|uniref:hypothetical protein n=1 Tax=Leisingera sp. ANG-M1 TaxID=1577895 RepID=UPI00057DF977|nr:hypothetical protein [Leisingera sp. ANG-M1]KIC11685.1 hypothetical protein RA19_06620 [Leisingera sp. ANG-M1]
MANPTRPPAKERARAAATAIAGILFLAFGIFGLTGRSDWNPLVSASERTAENIAVSSVAAYVSLRAINAALSTAQEVEVGASVVGQASLQPLKVLEPVDDTVERVADAVFLVAAGAALAAAGLAPVTSLGLAVLGAGLLGRAGAGSFPAFARAVKPACDRAIAFGTAAGLAVPLVFAAGAWLGERATAGQMAEAMAELQAVEQQAKILIGADTDTEAGSSAKEDAQTGAWNWLSSTVAQAGGAVSGAFEQTGRYMDAAQVFFEEADTILRSSLAIVGIFMLRMFVLPMFLMWGALTLLKTMPRAAAGRRQ